MPTIEPTAFFNAVNKDVEESKEEEDVYDRVAKATISGELPIVGVVAAENKPDSKNASGSQTKRSVSSSKKRAVNAPNKGENQAQTQKDGGEAKPPAEP